MAGNILGDVLRMTTFGESHGPAIGVVLDGVPPRIRLSAADIQKDLDRRRPGQSRVTTQRKESDRAEILSGVFDGKTTGTPLAILIRNQDQRSRDYSQIKDVFRPGHADWTYSQKYGIRDYRGGGRSSGRETACRVAAGAVARKILDQKKVKIWAYTLSIADIEARKRDLKIIEKNMVRCPDKEAADRMVRRIEQAKADGDSLGGVIEAIVKGCPPGLGDPVFGKLDAKLAYGLMSIGTVKGFEIGSGFAAAGMTGSEHNDSLLVKNGRVRSQTNLAGGILGGIATGEDIIVRVAVKPTSSIAKQQKTVNLSRKPKTIKIKGRHDPCLCPRVVPVVEAMVALTLADCLLIQRMVK